MEKVDQVQMLASNLSTFTIEDPQLASLLFQTGDLTISSYEERTGIYTLTYPNAEVRESYSLALITTITNKDEVAIKNLADTMRQALKDKDIDTLCSVLQTAFARIPYQIDKREEAHYHALFSLFMMSLGLEPESELCTNRGRIDMVLSTENYIYIFEIKVDTSAQVALQQIEERRYYERYINDKKKRTIVLVGIVFNKNDGESSISCSHKTITIT